MEHVCHVVAWRSFHLEVYFQDATKVALKEEHNPLICRNNPTVTVKRLTEFCVKCGSKLRKDQAFCPKCGTSVEGVTTPQSVQSVQPTPQPATDSNKVWGIDKRIFVVVVLFLILVVPVFPRDKVTYVDGSTQTVTMSTAYNTSFQTYATDTQISLKVYKGTLNYVTDSYYNNYYQYWYGSYNYNSCYYDAYYGGYVCSNYNYAWPYYGQSQYYYTVTVDPSDNVVKIQQTQESNGLWTLVLTHYDGTCGYLPTCLQDGCDSNRRFIGVWNSYDDQHTHKFSC